VTLGDVEAVALFALRVALADDRQDVALDGDVDAVGGDAGEVDVDPDVVATTVGVHRSGTGGVRTAGELIEEAVEITEGGVLEEHRVPFLGVVVHGLNCRVAIRVRFAEPFSRQQLP
jgi:hypothetical protein